MIALTHVIYVSVYKDSPRNLATAKSATLDHRSRVLSMCLVVIFYMSSCGSEKLFLTMQFIFGMCGPLRLSPARAVFTDECYSAGFMAGRYGNTVKLRSDLIAQERPHSADTKVVPCT